MKKIIPETSDGHADKFKPKHPFRDAMALYFGGVIALAIFAYGCKALLNLI